MQVQNILPGHDAEGHIDTQPDRVTVRLWRTFLKCFNYRQGCYTLKTQRMFSTVQKSDNCGSHNSATLSDTRLKCNHTFKEKKEHALTLYIV